MRLFNPLSLLGIGLAVLAFFGALRVRRDLASGETRWERALFGRLPPIARNGSPARYWLVIAVNTLLVLLFALAGAFALRVGALRFTRL